MKTRGYWIHKNSMDVFYEVLKVYNVHPEYVKVKFRCWNKSQCSDPWLLPGMYRSKVMKKDLQDWRKYVVC